VHAAWRRAHARQHASSLTAGTSLALLADELVPGRARTRLSAIERERARLADDLHADVLPDLSAVIREIEAGAAPEDAARRLRGIAAELRDLMSERRLAVLEELGLVRALEWLAERVEERTGVSVELDVVGGSHDDPETRPPHEVELAVYRVAQQALDNALLHARPRLVRVLIDVDATHVALQLGDDGVGMTEGAEDRALREGHLGLADMRQRAGSIGAAFSISPRAGGGTLVAVRWPG
jgi:signal transduction histidine kinase